MGTIKENISEKFILKSGYVHNKSLISFVAHYQPALAEGIAISQVFFFEKEGSWRASSRFKWEATDIITVSDMKSTMVLGRDGEVGLFGLINESAIFLEPGAATGPTRGVCKIEDTIFAFGMKREIYRQNKDKSWIRWNKGMKNKRRLAGESSMDAKKRMLSDIGGINAIVGITTNGMYAFGLGGEIWQTEGDVWYKIDSPTNLMLSDATFASDGKIYVCGKNGLILRGINQEWTVLEYEGQVNLDFCSIIEFNRKIYIADGHSLRVLNDNKLDIVDFGVGETVPCSKLRSGNGLLLSLAGKEAFTTVDGIKWTSIL